MKDASVEYRKRNHGDVKVPRMASNQTGRFRETQ